MSVSPEPEPKQPTAPAPETRPGGAAPADESAREQARRNLTANWGLEAGAGTGKTSVLVDRLLQHVAAGSALEGLVAITFTEKAAAELRGRLRDRLERLAQTEPDGPWRQGLDSLDQAYIGTIHGFAGQILREFPLEAGLPPEFGQLDALGAQLLRQEAWTTWWEAEMAAGAEPLALALQFDLNREQLEALADAMLKADPDAQDLPAIPPAPDWDGFAEELARQGRILANLSHACQDPADRGLRAIGTVVEAAQMAPALPASRLGSFLRRLKIHYTYGNRAKWNPPDACDQAKAILRALREEQEELGTAHGRHVLGHVLHWLRGYVDHYQRVKVAQAVVDFDDLLQRTRRLLLTHPEVRRAAHARYRHILVDEFQDTDPRQAEILLLIAVAPEIPPAEALADAPIPPGRLFVVGDPKQAIYRFRGADIHVYERVMARLGEPLRIQANFRCRPQIIDWVNATFAEVMDEPGQPEYIPLLDSRPDLAGAPAAVQRLPLAGPAPPGLQALRDLEARTIAAWIARAVQAGWPVTDRAGSHALSYGDVAILMPKLTDVALFEDALQREGIPYRIEGGKRFYARDEVAAVATALRALDHPEDAVAVVGALRGPFFNCPDDQLHAWHQAGGAWNYLLPTPTAHGAPQVAWAMACLARISRQAREHPPAWALGQLFEETAALEAHWLTAHGEQAVANLHKCLDLARSLGGRPGFGLRALANYLDRLRTLQQDEAESPVADASLAAVQLMSIHKAKGLEFPLVILANLAGDGHRQSPSLMWSTDRRLVCKLGHKGQGIGLPSFAAWEAAEQREQLESGREERRLLYVACTRARDYLIISTAAESMEAKQQGLLAPLLPHVARLPEQIVPEEALTAKDLPVLRTGRATPADTRPVAETVAAWRMQQQRLAALPAGLLLQTPSQLAEAAPHASSGSAAGARFGTAFHAVLAALPLAGRPGDQARLAARLTAHYAAEQGVDEHALLTCVRRFLDSPLAARIAAATRCWQELPFALSHTGGVLEGSIDLVFQEGSGLVIVDYKTDQATASVLPSLAAQYAPQVQAYAQALAHISGLPVQEALLAFVRAPGGLRVIRV